MRSRVDVMLDVIDQAHAESLILFSGDYDPRDLARLIIDVGSEAELYLKTTVFEGKASKNNFYDLIQALTLKSVGAQTIQHLNDLRTTYNKAKHNPSYRLSSVEALKVLSGAKTAMQEISRLGVGLSNAPFRQVLRRTFWIAAWDYYTSGDTEIQLILPTEASDFPPDLDMIYIDWKAWDLIRAKLEGDGVLRLGKGTVPDWFYQQCAAEDGFIEVGVFEGEYRELIKLLSTKEKRQDLIPFLLRENDSASMYAAVLLATVDTIAEGLLSDDAGELAERILNIAAHKYAAPRSSGKAKKYAKHNAKLLLSIPRERRILISGPFWISINEFKSLEKNASVRSDEYRVMVLPDGRLITTVHQ